MTQFARDPIECAHLLGPDGVPGDFIDNYCWVTGTYTAHPNDLLQDPSDSLDHMTGCNPQNDERRDKDCWHHGYYQWVAIILVCQAACFYFPRYVH